MADDIRGQATFDSRDVEERIDELEDAAIEAEDGDLDPNLDPDETEELAALIALRDEVDGRDWRDGITFIADSYFEDYAREYADDTGLLSDGGWPFTCIDWEQAARELQYDYSSVELDGYTYWFLA